MSFFTSFRKPCRNCTLDAECLDCVALREKVTEAWSDPDALLKANEAHIRLAEKLGAPGVITNIDRENSTITISDATGHDSGEIRDSYGEPMSKEELRVWWCGE